MCHLLMSSDSLLTRCLKLSYNKIVLSNLVLLGKECHNFCLVAGALGKLECLEIHDAQVHSIGNKPQEPRSHTFIMPGDDMEDKDWEPARVPVSQGIQSAVQHLRE